MGVTYAQVELNAEGRLDLPAIRAAMKPQTRVVAIQRSRGYSTRRSLTPEETQALADMLHQEFPNACLMVDNCYGEFVCEKEPTHFGADVCVGSLIKNPGGGLAPTGGYVVGRAELVERISYRLTAPSIGLEVGSYAGGYQLFYQGLFVAPHVVAQALRTAVLAAAVFGGLGMRTTPGVEDPRTDIIQALELGSPERLIAFCQGIQMASPVDSMALPEPWDMPGYQEQVIMAAGTFVSGASIELSADAPLRQPYAVYLQGGLTYSHERQVFGIRQCSGLPALLIQIGKIVDEAIQCSHLRVNSGQQLFRIRFGGYFQVILRGLLRGARTTPKAAANDGEHKGNSQGYI